MEVTRENLTKKSFLHEAQLESKLFSYSSKAGHGVLIRRESEKACSFATVICNCKQCKVNEGTSPIVELIGNIFRRNREWLGS